MPDVPPADESTGSLMDCGYAALERDEHDEALALAAELRRRRHSSCFEIEARARWAMGERDAAVAVLEEGVEKAAKAWPLWHWLGTFRSNLGRYEAALEAFAREAEFEEVPPSASAYNIAVVYERMGRPGDALDVLDRIELPGNQGPEPAHFAELRARLLFGTGQYAAAIASASAALESFADEASADDASGRTPDWQVLGRAYTVRADAKLRSGDAAGAMEDAAEAVELLRAQAPARALDVLRRAEGRRPPEGRRLKLLLEGELPADEGEGRRGFFVSVDVVASDATEGLQFARRFVPEPARPGLEVAEVEDLGPAGEELGGVYFCSGLAIFDPDAPGDENEASGPAPA